MTRLHDALESCLTALRSGADLDACLGMYPDLAEDLRPALEAAQAAMGLASESIPAAAGLRSSSTFLAKARSLRPSAPRRRSFVRAPRLAFAILAALLAVFVGSGGLLVASAAALPGDPLYAVKRTAEDLRLRLAPLSSQTRLEQAYNSRRAEEIRALFDLGRVSPVHFEGVVTAMADDLWTVEDLSVHLTPQTLVEGEVAAGRTVEVSGETESTGTIHAQRIRLRGFDASGIVGAIRGREWDIGELTVEVPRGTPIDAGTGPGARVLVQLRVDDDGGLVARSVTLLEPVAPPPSETPAPTPLPSEEALEDVELEGLLQSINGSTWIVDGRQVVVSPETRIEGQPDPGDTVRVEGVQQPGGIILAERIRVEDEDDGDSSVGQETASPPGPTQTPDADDGEERDERVEFTGEVESIEDGLWVIDGQAVMVTSETEIDGDPEVGDRVRVRAVRMTGGDLVAERIERDD